ncbi:MAG: hypothetical protein DRJ44_02610 [Thermoprotei archaeon]|nr:MAG: hypothetical protein DRJ44_02610 [Thermoprotei archaeon]
MALPPPPKPARPGIAVGEYTPSDDEKLFGLIAWLIPVIGSLVVMLTKKESKFALFHAKQALIIHIGLGIIHLILWIPGFFILLPLLLDIPLLLIHLALMIYGAFMAYTGKWLKIPVIADLATKF